MECKSLRESGKDLQALEVAVYAASTDDADTNKSFAEKLELDYPILSDPGGQFAASIGVLNLTGRAHRWTYYIAKDGTLLHVDKDVTVRSHGRDIAAKLAELGVPKRP